MFKRQDNDKRGKVCGKNFCEILIIPHNLANKIQLLDISANNTARSFISGRYNYWLANEVLKQLRVRKGAPGVKVCFKLTVTKKLLARWIINLYNTFKEDKKMTINGFRSAGITEAIENAKDMVENFEKLIKRVCLVVKHVFFCKHMKRRHDSLIFLFFLNFPFLTTLPYPTQLNQIIV